MEEQEGVVDQGLHTTIQVMEVLIGEFGIME